MTSYWAQHALLPDGLASAVLIEIADGRFTAVTQNSPQGTARRLPGVVMPGFANCHSHAFHRALRGRTHGEGGTFWTWRDRMYHVAAQLDPDNYLALARAAYAEIALAGITAVGEFHYVHQQPDGRPYDDPNAMGVALQQAAKEAGIRLTLLDTCYLSGGLTAEGHSPLVPEQLRFGDKDAITWGERVSQLRKAPDENAIGVAVHSVRAVPFDQLEVVAQLAQQVCDATFGGAIVHAHVSEQPAENEACQGFYGRTPTQVLADAGLVDSGFTAVHATHLIADDEWHLAAAGATACFCPTTERDLADGIGPARALHDNGARLSLGSDQHAVVDMFEEMRALESHERLVTGRRGRFTPSELLTAATAHRSIGWEAGQIAVGQLADLVAVRLDSPRTAGSRPDQVLYAATAGDVDTVIRGGEVVVQGGHHRLGDVGRLLQDAIRPFWEDA